MYSIILSLWHWLHRKETWGDSKFMNALDTYKTFKLSKTWRKILRSLSSLKWKLLSCVWLFVTLCSPPGSSVDGILQARILKWAAIPFSRVSSWPKDWTSVSWVAGRLYTAWDTREALWVVYILLFLIYKVFFFSPLWIQFPTDSLFLLHLL